MLPQNVTSIQLKLKYSNVRNGNGSLGSAVQCFQNFNVEYHLVEKIIGRMASAKWSKIKVEEFDLEV